MKRFLLIAISVIFAFNINAQIFSDDFEDDDISDWLTVSPTYGTQPYTWHVYYYETGEEHYLSVACFDGINNATEQWIVTPSFSTVGYTNMTVTFDNRARYNPYEDLKLFVSTDFAGDSAGFESATWTEITGFELDVSYDDYVWVVGAHADMGAVGEEENVYLAFKYLSIDGDANSGGGNWTVDNVVVTEAVGVSEINSGLKIYPNPATSVLNISSITNINNITISNVIGQRVLNINNINSKTFSIEAENLSNGVYIINIQNNNGTGSISKFIKE